jgi:hypothetical protein
MNFKDVTGMNFQQALAHTSDNTQSIFESLVPYKFIQIDIRQKYDKNVIISTS